MIVSFWSDSSQVAQRLTTTSAFEPEEGKKAHFTNIHY